MQESDIDAPRAIAAGLAAGTAYLGAMWLDNRLSSYEFDDLKLVGQAFTTKSPWWLIQGLTGHYGFSMVMALVYARFAYRLLPGPGALKGIAFLNIENLVLYPGGLVVDRIHAGMRQGELPPMMSKKAFLGQVVRHIAFGATLGLLYKPKSVTKTP
ncbi:MAG: hypothetical protein ABI670_10415 [Chloroflexota bacterium]